MQPLQDHQVFRWHVDMVNSGGQNQNAVGEQQNADEEPDGNETFAFNHAVTRREYSELQTPLQPQPPKIAGASTSANRHRTEFRLRHKPGQSIRKPASVWSAR